jgi:hypothetical protein
MSLIDNFNNKANFWVVNPQLTTLGVFKRLYDEDSSKQKEDSSKAMWSIAFYTDSKSKYINMPDEDRKKLIASDYYDPNFNDPLTKELITFYKDTQLTQPERSLLNLFSKLQERDAFLADTPYTIDNAESLDRILSNTKKLYDLYEKIKEDLDKETLTVTNRGGSLPSLTDSGEI